MKPPSESTAPKSGVRPASATPPPARAAELAGDDGRPGSASTAAARASADKTDAVAPTGERTPESATRVVWMLVAAIALVGGALVALILNRGG
jgi:hypothetical protein